MKVKELSEKLLAIEHDLEQLSRVYSDLYKDYLGEEFPEQNQLAEDKLDNLVLAATHEMASQIGFYRQDLISLTQYIGFRKQFSVFSGEELELIIDKANLSSIEKLKLQEKTNQNSGLVIEDIERNWVALFKNKMYRKIKPSL